MPKMDGRIPGLLIAVLFTSITSSGEQVSVDNAPKIVTNDGNLMFQTGNSKAIHFETLGNGNIKFNDIEIRDFYGQMKVIKTYIDQNRNSNNQCDCNAMKVTIASNTQKIQNLKNKLKRATSQMSTLSTTVNDLQRISGIDECTNNPCHNGGICIDGFGKYKCLCKDQYKGANCMEDVNECTQLSGTDLGCQNNARCENFVGGFRCICSGKWSGVLCNTPQNGCAGSSNAELCGHGLCLPDHSNNNQRSFKCICDHGWSLDPLTNTCISDINECTTGRHPCSELPLVPCNNIPGSFTCGQCPHGYEGNGFSCTDVNECLNANTCGINQQCINTMGSYKCQCVEGMTYNENGICQRQNICQINNGGCSNYAQCTQTSFNIEGRICSCNSGYTGNGVGPTGCIQASAGNATNNYYRRCLRRQLCRNGGTCQPTETGFTCQCAATFSGPRCRTQSVNRCLQNPCLNGGRCTVVETNSYHCTCMAYFTGRNCETEHSECGGSIISPRFPRQIIFLTSSSATMPLYRYPCVWTVLVSDEQFIQVKPINITRQWTSPCAEEYLQILEKSTSDGDTRQLAKYCIDNPQVDQNGYNTTGPILIIKAQFVNGAPNRKGFNIGITPFSYISQNLDCCRCLNGQHVITQATTGIFTSPHYPLNYPTGTDCIMQFEREFGQRYRVAISISALDLGDSNGNCSETDFIKIHYVERGETKITACNQANYQNQYFITSGFKLQFHSDAVTGQSPSRFKISWMKTVNNDPCGEILSFQNTASIEAPSLSENQEAYCTWNIHRSNYSQMILLKGLFSNWQNGDCSVYIKVLNVDLNNVTTLLFEQCQNTVMLDEILEQITGQLIIIFRKPLGISTPSFRISATYVCGKVIDMDQLTTFEFSTPNYPNNYDNDLNCTYKFIARTRSFSINFIDFEIVDDYPCLSDYVAIQGATKSFSNGRFCSGNMDYLIPVDKAPSQENLIINFRSNSSGTGRGFRALVNLLDCGGSYYLSSRLVIAYPEDHLNNSNSNIEYQHNKNCVWNIISPVGSYIFTIFDHFHVEQHTGCRYDYLAVTYDNVTDRRYCGNDIPNVVTRSNKLKLEFKSDYSVSGEGFVIRLYLGSMDTHCHKDIVAPEGQIVNPLAGSMPRPYFCKYSITVPSGRKVVMNITIEGAMEGNYSSYNLNRCYAKTRLRIKNGYMGSVTLTELCLENPQRGLILTSSNKASIIYFVPAYRTTYEFNFTISFHSIDEECGSIHNDDYGEIASVNYPLFAPVNTYCQWEIQSTPGRQISIRFIHVRAGSNENTFNCNDDKSPVIRLVSLSQEYSILCHSHTEDIYRFNDNIVRVIFRNLANSQYRFRLLYKKECTFATDSTRGRIESNNLITGYPNYCSWKINILRGNTLHIQFDQFDLPNAVNGDCRAYVRIMGSQKIVMENSCGNTLINNTFQSSNSPVTIRHFVSRRIPYNILQAHLGFSLEYNTEGCIYNIFYDPNLQSNSRGRQSSSGIISSPNYPDSVSNLDCSWTFKTIIGYSIKITFDVIELDSFVNCSEGHILKARDTENPNDNYTFIACEQAHVGNPVIFQSTTHFMDLKFFSAKDANGGHRKFHAKYEFINKSCEYQITATEGYIKSPNYPGVYPTNANCRWDLSVRDGMSIHLNFLNFDIEGSSCRYDYVQLFSQLNADTMPMTRLCGNQVSPTQLFQSFDNNMLVTFKTDFSVQRSGFRARFFEGCGGLRNASEQKRFLMSPNYPHQYSLRDGLCEWTISANVSNPGERIFFYFFGFEGHSTDLSQNCSLNTDIVADNSLAIIDGLEDTPIKAILCSNQPAPPIISTGHFLRIILKSTNGRSVFRAGFGTGSSACGGEFFLDDGILTSPFYPNAVNIDMDCIYIIKNSPGSDVELTIDDFARTNNNAYALHDFLEIRIGNAFENSQLIGRYYSQMEMQNATTNVRFNDSVILRFRSQGGEFTNTIKFLARYHISYQSEFTNNQGMFASPQFGHLYKSDTIQTWTINPVNIPTIEIKFLNFSVGRLLESGDCDRGKLIITDGDMRTKSLCGPNPPDTKTYSAPVTVVLDAQGYRYNGFLLKWSVPRNDSYTVLGPCHYQITATKLPQFLTSPNYPNFDPVNRDCQWNIVAPRGRSLQLQMENFTMENSRNCKYENFTISMTASRSYQVQSNRYRWHFGSRNRLFYISKMFCGTQNTSLLDFTDDLTFNFAVINFKVDEVDYFPGFRLRYNLRCYQEINSIEGWLQNEEFPNYIKEFKNCTYILRVSGDRHYQLNFTSISLPPETNGQCTDGYIEISTDVVIGKFCGSTVPSILQPLLTNTSAVLIKMVGSFNQHSTFSGFQLKYSLIEVEECGGTHLLSSNNDEVMITNPRNGTSSLNYVECKWLISSPYGTRMRIDFLELIIGSRSFLCDESFLALYDGSTILSRKIGNKNYCHLESSVFTSDRRLLVFFKFGVGFATFKIRISVGLCGGHLYKSSGIIVSPNYPNPYPKQTKCVWTIQYSRANSVSIRFDEYYLNNDCSRANLTIFSTDFPSRFNWSNCNNQPAPIEITSSIVEIIFNSNSLVSGRGFKLSYQLRNIECGATLNSPSGESMSIHYPQNIPQNTACIWRINADVSKRVTIKILNLNLRRRCLYIRNELDERIKRFCQVDLTNYEFDTKSSIVTLILYSDGYSRLSFQYHTDQPSLCGGHIYRGTNQTGLITFDGNTTISYCHYIVHNSPGDTGTIAFKMTNYRALNCVRNKITFKSIVYEDIGTNSIIDFLTFCNVVDYFKPIYTTIGKTVDIKFINKPYARPSNQSITLAYKYQDCGGILTDTFGVITSPNYPNKYPHHSNCEWIIRTQRDMHIQLVIQSLHLENHQSCRYDYLYIRFGPEFDSPPMKMFCGRHTIANETIIFRTNQLRLSFKSDMSAAEDGFLIQYNLISAVDHCNGFVFNTSGSIQSPNYPQPYPSNIRCNWTVVVPQGYRIELTVQQPFDLEYARNNQCPYDALEIIDSFPDVVLARLCGHVPPTAPILSSENRIGIQFSTDYNLNLDGFRVTYRSLCGGTYNKTYGDITSPGVLIPSLGYQITCQFVIPSWKNHLTVVGIQPQLRDCNPYYTNGYVEIWKETVPGRYVFGQKICGRSRQGITVFNSLSIMIKYNLTTYVSKTFSFKAKYMHDETVKIYTNFTDRKQINTPQFPTPYHHNADLQWKFQAPANYIFHIEIQYLDIEASPFECLYDYVAFYGSSIMNSSTLVSKLCGLQKKLIPFKIESNNISIHFVSDSSHYANHTGFTATIISTPGQQLGCGGSLYLEPDTTGSLASIDLNNDGKYDRGLYCQWDLSAPRGYVVHLRFQNNSISLEKRSRMACRHDWLRIHDGQFQTSPLIYNLCGNDSVDPFTSSGSNLLVNFQTDGSVEDRGFRLYYSVARSLGNVYLNATEEYQIMTSPGYPDNTDYSFKSSIEIFAPNETDHILIELKELTIRPTTNCSLDRLIIRDVSMKHVNQLRKFCKPIELPVPFISSDNKVIVNYQIGSPETLGNTPGLRYKIEYKIYSCNRTEKAYSGRLVNIESLKSKFYSHNTICNLTLEAPSSNLKYQFYFKKLILENSITCAYDYLQFSFGRPGELQYALPRLCGSDIPPSFVSNSSYVNMLFVSDSSVALEGFDITYVVNRDPLKTCGGDIELDSGVVTSPGFGRNVYESGHCTWNIESFSKKDLSWTITDLQLGQNIIIGETCNTSEDYVQVTYGRVTRRFCGNIPPSQEFQVRSGPIIIEYRSLNGGVGIGFKLEWNTIVMTTSYIMNPLIN